MTIKSNHLLSKRASTKNEPHLHHKAWVYYMTVALDVISVSWAHLINCKLWLCVCAWVIAALNEAENTCVNLTLNAKVILNRHYSAVVLLNNVIIKSSNNLKLCWNILLEHNASYSSCRPMLTAPEESRWVKYGAICFEPCGKAWHSMKQTNHLSA